MENINRHLKAIFDFDSRLLGQKNSISFLDEFAFEIIRPLKNTKGDCWCPFMFKEMDWENFIT